MLGLHLIDTTLAHNRQLTTLKAETSAGKEGNELLSCGLAGLKTVPPKQNLTVTQKHSQQPQKSFHAHQTSFCSLNIFGCLFFHLFHAYMHVLTLVFLLWHPALKAADTCCIHGSAHRITNPQYYLFLKHRWTILNMKFPHHYFEVGKSIKLIIHNTTTIAKLTLFQMHDQSFLKIPPECSVVSKNLQEGRAGAHFVGT